MVPPQVPQAKDDNEPKLTPFQLHKTTLQIIERLDDTFFTTVTAVQTWQANPHLHSRALDSCVRTLNSAKSQLQEMKTNNDEL